MRASKWMLIGPLLCGAAGVGLVLGTGADDSADAPRASAAEDRMEAPAARRWPMPVFVGGNTDWALRIDTTPKGERVYSLRVAELPDPPKGVLEEIGDPSHPNRYVLEGPVHLPPKFSDTLEVTIIPVAARLPCRDASLKPYDHALVVRMTTTGVWTGCGSFRPR